MKRLGILVVAVASCFVTVAVAAPKDATTKWNDEAAKAARAAVEKGLASVETLDPEALRSQMVPGIVAYDIDLESKPIRMGSLDEALAYVAALSAEAKKMGAKVKFENTKYNCHATADLAYCLLEYDFTATLPDGTRMVQPSQTTVVLSKIEGAWKWAHWHTSLSATPAATSK